MNLLFRGAISATVESLVGWHHSRASLQFTFYADLPYVDVNLRVHWQERGKCLKLVLPLRLRECKAICEAPFAAIERPTDGTENVGGRWVRLEEKGGDRLAVGVANDGQYGFHARSSGELGLSLLRGAVHCRFGEQPAKAGEHHNYMDQGQHDFRFRLLWAKAPALAKALIPAAMELNLPLEAFSACNQPESSGAAESLLEIRPETVAVSALKRAEDGKGLILRLNETLGKATRAEIKLAGLGKPVRVDLRRFEVKTLRITREEGVLKLTPCSLLESAD